MHKPEGKTQNSLIMELEYLQQVAKTTFLFPLSRKGNAQIIGIHLVIVALKGESAWGSVYVCGCVGGVEDRETDRQTNVWE